MSEVSKKRHRSFPGLGDDSFASKRIKIDPESIVLDDNAEHHSGKKKKHKRHRGGADDSFEHSDLSYSQADSLSSSLVHKVKSEKSKHKHRKDEDSCANEWTLSHTEQENQDEQTAEVNSNEVHKKHKKKKKHRDHDDDGECLTVTDVVIKSEYIDLDGDATSIPHSSVPEMALSMDENLFNGFQGQVKKKKKKKKNKQDGDDESPCFVPVINYEAERSNFPECSQSERLSSAKALQRAYERCRPMELHINSKEMRYKAEEGFREVVPDHKRSLWWEDIAEDPSQELWLVRAPVDFSASVLNDSRGALYDSVVVPHPGQPGEGFQVSIQGVQKSKLVVLLPSKQDKKFHVASDINGYVTITRTSAFAQSVAQPQAEQLTELSTDLISDAGTNRRKKHKSKDADEANASQKKTQEKQTLHSVTCRK